MSTLIPITTPYITLGQALKLTGAIDTGGQTKWFLSEFHITVNGETENRRGKKLYLGDTIEIETVGSFQISEDS